MLPAQRFHVTPRNVAAYDEGALPTPLFPIFPGLVGETLPSAVLSMPTAEVQTEDEDNRFVATLCDQCMRRIASLFDVRVETQEEFVARNVPRSHSHHREVPAPMPIRMSDPIADGIRSVIADGIRSVAGSGNSTLEMIKAAERTSQGKVVTQYPNKPDPNSGGLVQQFRTPEAHGASAPPSGTEQSGEKAPEMNSWKPLQGDGGDDGVAAAVDVSK